MSATSLCQAWERSATQYRQIRSLIHSDAQPYRILSLIPNPTSTFIVQQERGGIQRIVVRGLGIRAVKDRLAPTIPMITVET
jgi:hypothetical protein